MAMGNIPSIFTTAIFEGFSSGTYFSLRCTAISNDFAHQDILLLVPSMESIVEGRRTGAF